MKRGWNLKQKLAILARYADCPLCGEGFERVSDIQWDHIGAHWATGDNDVSNGRPIHVNCHKAKTKRDAFERAKTKRLEKKRLDALDAGAEQFMEAELGKLLDAYDTKPKRPWPKRELGHWGGHNPFYADIKAGNPPWPKRKIPSRPKKET